MIQYCKLSLDGCLFQDFGMAITCFPDATLADRICVCPRAVIILFIHRFPVYRSELLASEQSV